jgi:hypothetical protein
VALARAIDGIDAINREFTGVIANANGGCVTGGGVVNIVPDQVACEINLRRNRVDDALCVKACFASHRGSRGRMHDRFGFADSFLEKQQTTKCLSASRAHRGRIRDFGSLLFLDMFSQSHAPETSAVSVCA